MNIILILSVNAAICLILYIAFALRATIGDVADEFTTSLCVTGAMTLFGIIDVFLFPYPYITVTEYSPVFFVIFSVSCAVTAAIAYRFDNSRNDECADPLTTAAMCAVIQAIAFQIIFPALLMFGIFTYSIPSGETRRFSGSFFESEAVSIAENAELPPEVHEGEPHFITTRDGKHITVWVSEDPTAPAGLKYDIEVNE